MCDSGDYSVTDPLGWDHVPGFARRPFGQARRTLPETAQPSRPLQGLPTLPSDELTETSTLKFPSMSLECFLDTRARHNILHTPIVDLPSFLRQLHYPVN